MSCATTGTGVRRSVIVLVRDRRQPAAGPGTTVMVSTSSPLSRLPPTTSSTRLSMTTEAVSCRGPAPVARSWVAASPSPLVRTVAASNWPAPTEAGVTAKVTGMSGRRLRLRAES